MIWCCLSKSFWWCQKRFKRTFRRAAIDLGENVEVSVNIEERVERRAWVTFSKIHSCLKGKWDICLCFCKSFYFCGFLPAAQLVVDSVVGPGHYITKLTLVKFLWPIQFWWYLFFSRWLSDRYTPGSPQLSSWLVRASCTEVLQRPAFIFSFLDFAKDLRKWSRVSSAPCIEVVESGEWWKDCKFQLNK